MGTRRIEMENRRESIIAARSRMQILMDEKFPKLSQIWDMVGMSEEQRRDRTESAMMHTENLWDEMLNEEQSMYETLRDSVQNYGKEIHMLSRDLQEPVEELNESLTLLEAEELLRYRLEELHLEKQRRLKLYKHLHEEDAEFSQKLNIVPFYIAQNTIIPSNEQLEMMRMHLEQAKLEVQQNASKLKEYRTGIQKYVKKLNYPLKTDFEKQFSESEKKEFTNLSRDFLQQAEEFYNKLKATYEIYLEDIKRRMNEIKAELDLWFEKCHVGEKERQKFVHASEENFDEIALKRYNDEINRLKSYYAEREEILEKVASWKRMWDNKLAYEDKDKDRDRLLNRGGALLQEEKVRKKLEKQLVAVRSEIKNLLNQWTIDHPNESILFDGYPILQRLEKFEADYQAKKETEKAAKLMAKKQQVEAERLYGVSPATPTKRPIRGMILRRTPTPPTNQNTSSRPYVHSSLAATRSPSNFQTCSTRAQNGASKGAGLPPKPAAAKRKALVVDDRPVMPLGALNKGAPALDTSVGSTTSSGTYRDFAAEVREKGAEGQSSFIVLPPSTPNKIARK